MDNKMIRWAFVAILFACSIFESTAQVNLSADRDQRLAKWNEFNNGSMDALLAVQEELIRQQAIANLLPLLASGVKDAQPYWKPGAPEYEEARAVLLRTLKPIFAEQLSGIYSLAATYSPDYRSFTDMEIDSLYTFANTYPKERWATMNNCGVALIMVLASAQTSKSASRSVVDSWIKKLMPNPNDCNPTQTETEMLEAFSQTSAYQKHAQATARGLARLTAPQFREPFLNAVKKAVADRFQSEVLPELTPVLRKLEVRIASESFSSQN